ncbi:ATP-dependent RNA helicase DDX51-like [Glandiceps talaboti]
MALFSISRYMGGDDDVEDETTMQETHLSTLYDKVKTRQLKRRNQHKDSQDVNSAMIDGKDNSDSTLPKKRKKQKRTKEIVMGEEEDLKEDQEINVGKKERQKQSRRMKQVNLDVDNEEDLIQEEHNKSSTLKENKHSQSNDSNELPSNTDISKCKMKDGKKHKKCRKDTKSKVDKACDVNNEDSHEENLKDIVIPSDDESNSGDEEKGGATKNNISQAEIESGDEDDAKDNEDSDVVGFTILGDRKLPKTDQVHRVLPDWLSHPSIINNDMNQNKCKIEDLPQIDKQLQSRLQEMGITHFFPVQHQVIPAILSSVRNGLQCGVAGFRPSDLCVSAPTGSGKTLAFVIPVIQALMGRVVCHVRALAVLPTRDLAMQIYQVFNIYCKGTDLKVVLIGANKSFTQEQTALVTSKYCNGYMSQADIVIATPGRLVDHITRTPGFTLRSLRFLIIDEADRMMDQMSKDWIKQVENAAYDNTAENGRPLPGPVTIASISRIHTPLQKLLFSATLSQNPEKLMHLNLFQPKLFTSVVRTSSDDVSRETKTGEFVGKYTTPVGLSEYLIQCSAGDKPQIVLYLLKEYNLSQVLCFTNSIEVTHRLYLLLKLYGGITVAEFSSSLSIQQRKRLVNQFKNGDIQIMICSDAMARGMDIIESSAVICYDVPPFIKTYIHRVGRTARAGRQGTAYTLVLDKERQAFVSSLKNCGKLNIQWMTVKMESLQAFTDSYEVALKSLQDTLEQEEKKKKPKKK